MIPRYLYALFVTIVVFIFGWLYELEFLYLSIIAVTVSIFVIYGDEVLKLIKRNVLKGEDMSIKAFKFLKVYWKDTLGTGEDLSYFNAIIKEGFFEGERVYGFNLPSARTKRRVIAVIGMEQLRIKFLDLTQPGRTIDPLEVYSKLIPSAPSEYSTLDNDKMIKQKLRDTAKETTSNEEDDNSGRQ